MTESGQKAFQKTLLDGNTVVVAVVVIVIVVGIAIVIWLKTAGAVCRRWRVANIGGRRVDYLRTFGSSDGPTDPA